MIIYLSHKNANITYIKVVIPTSQTKILSYYRKRPYGPYGRDILEVFLKKPFE